MGKWEEASDPSSIHGAGEKSAIRAAWLAALDAENAAGNRALQAQALLDLVKSFEAVPHAALWEAAKRRGYPLATLRLALAAYLAPRTVVIDGTCSRPVFASRGITAGSGTATAELPLLMLDVLGELALAVPEAKVDG